MKKYILSVVFLLFLFVFSGCSSNVAKKVTFRKPDIKDEFCGVQINFQYCKCAFHNQYCDEVGMKKGDANTYVQKQYDTWISGQLKDFEKKCQGEEGIFEKDECRYCKEGFAADNGDCVREEDLLAEKEDSDTDNGNDGTAAAAGEPLNPDCTINEAVFGNNWKKYSDIDNAIPFEDRSYEAKQALVVYENMINKMVEGFSLERDQELESQMKAELILYRDALVKNIKVNLLKSFWRLSWVTYSTIKSGSSLGDSYSNLVTEGASIETLGAGLKVIQGMVPSESELAIDTSTLSGKAKSVGLSVALEAVDSLGDPVKIATEVFNSSANAVLPSADLTQEEVNILKDQHIKKGSIDETLRGIETRNAERAAKIAKLETEIAILKNDVGSWEIKEKDRVAFEFEDSCKKQKNN